MTPARRRCRGFTLIELMVVIGIIVLLAAILMPVVSRVRKQAYNTASQSEMQRILLAIQNYYHDFNAYPGPIANVNLQYGASPSNGLITKGITSTNTSITSSENLVLGLLGMLNPDFSTSPPTITFSATLPPAHDVVSLNGLRPATYHYIDYVPNELSSNWATLNPAPTGVGLTASMTYVAGASPGPTDTNVPEFVDHFPDPMPILYTRANIANPDGASTATSTPQLQYHWQELSPYGFYEQTSAGANWLSLTQSNQEKLYSDASSLDGNVATPYTDFWPPNWTPATAWPAGNYYFANPNIAGTTRGKDGFLLIGAGLDRTYGTLDDTILTP